MAFGVNTLDTDVDRFSNICTIVVGEISLQTQII